MTQSYSQIQKQIQALQLKADKLRAREVDGVIARIRVAIEHYGLNAEQLFAAKSAARKAKAQTAAPTRSAKYSDGQGNAWSGMGKRPNWLREALSAGRALEEFATGTSPATTKSVKVKAKKRKSKTLYRDEAGHTWSGMGPRPRWLKEALEAGKTLEEMTG